VQPLALAVVEKRVLVEKELGRVGHHHTPSARLRAALAAQLRLEGEAAITSQL
jgi:hypothetical protein